MDSLRPIAGVFTGAASCVTLCAQIIDLLNTAKENKAEFKSLLAAVQGIHAFLLELPTDGITSQGSRVLAQLHANLLGAAALLSRVSQMGPLLSLIKAYSVRDQFLRVNKDIVNTFNILAAGEQLLVLAHSRASKAQQIQQSQAQQVQQIQTQLVRARNEFFVQEEAALNRLRDVASAGKHASWPEQLLHRRLLDQLQALPQLSELQPEQLLAEYRALQMMVMYNGEQPGTAGAGAGGAEGDAASTTAEGFGGVADTDSSSKKKGLDEEMEEFLVEQVCAALAATVAATSTGPLTPEAALAPPSDFLCPISSQLMVQPVMLVETGHSYEAAHIQRWLDSHDTCPISRHQLSSKQLVTNYNLKKAIASWAADHGISLPAAPVYTSLHAGLEGSHMAAQHAVAPGVRPSAPNMRPHAADDTAHVPVDESSMGITTAAAVAGRQQADRAVQEPLLPGRDTAMELDQQRPRQQQQGGLASKDTGSVVIDHMPSAELQSVGTQLSTMGSKQPGCGCKGCTRTRWAIGLTALLLLAVAGVATGVGVFLSNRMKRGSAAAPIQAAASSPVVPPALGTNGTSPSPSPPLNGVPVNNSTNKTLEKGPLLNRTVISYNMQCGGKSSDLQGGWVGCGGPGRECADAAWSGVQCELGYVCTCDNDTKTPQSGEWWWSCQPEVLDPQPGPVQCGTYIVKQGDSFWKLSIDRGFALADIQAANPGVVPESLQIGQKINLPCKSTNTSSNSTVPGPSPALSPAVGSNTSTCGTYTIKQGDTFLKLAMDKGFPLSDLLAVNPGVVPESLVVGQTVNMPCQGADQNVFSVVLQQHIPLQDLACEGEAFCRLCDRAVADIANSCVNQPTCVAFVIDQQTACGYLKTAATSLAAGANHVTYCLRSRGANCAGAFSYYPQTDVKDAGDFSCSQLNSNGTLQSFCFEFGTISQVAGACELHSGCKAFVTAQRDKKDGGYLKDTTGPRSFAVKTDLYVKNT